MPDDFKKASPGRRKALSDIIGREAEAIFDRAQRSQEETAALHRVAELLFVEADRLDPKPFNSIEVVGEHDDDTGDDDNN